MRRLARTASIGALIATAHTALNLWLLRVPPAAGPGAEPISVLLPLRDEAARVEPCLRALVSSLTAYAGRAELVVLDDESTDGTAGVVARIAPDARLIAGVPLPAGWLGKPHACAQAAAAADPSSTAYVFLDADVVLAADGLARTVALLRAAGLALVSPYPRQVAQTPATRLVQPLLQWSWLTFLPLRAAERSARASLAAANGQLLCVDAAAYRAVGGHGAVRDRVIEDMELLKAAKRKGFRGVVADGTDIATCHMYEGWASMRDGYAKSLWAAFGSPAGAAATLAMLAALYVLPPLAWLRHPRDPVLAAGAAAGVGGRVLVARRVGGRVWPDSAAHPASVGALAWLTALSLVRRRRGRLAWKGRSL